MGKQHFTSKTVDDTALIKTDPLLKPYRAQLRERFAHYQRFKAEIEKTGGILGEISQGHQYFGFNRGENVGETGVWYREWAPGAHTLALIGDFNGWDRGANPMSIDDWGVWHLFLSDRDYADRLTHESRVKVHVVSELGGLDRIPAYIQRVVQEGDTDFTGQYWAPPSRISGNIARLALMSTPKACESTRHTLVWHRKRKRSEPSMSLRKTCYPELLI